MNYYQEIKEKLIKSEIYDKVKDYSKDKHKVKVYYEIGKILSEAGKEYGKNIINKYSEKLVVDVGKKYNYRTLYRMRKFYDIFKSEKLTPLVSKLCWSHYILLLSLKDEYEIIYYINVAVNNNLNKRQFQELINNREYNRLNNNTKIKLSKQENLTIYDLVPNPVIINACSFKNKISEYALKESILSNMDDFLRQLGKGFCYVRNEYKINLGDRYNYIDLLLYNIKYKCYVVIELKVTELRKEHTGQIMTYMNYIDNNIKSIDDNDTVGIIICKQNNEYVIKYCSDERIISREYELV